MKVIYHKVVESCKEIRYNCMGLEYGGIFPTVDARLQNYKQTWTHSDEKHDEESRNLIIMAKTLCQVH